MTDTLDPHDPLLAATESLRRGTPLLPGLPERVGKRRVVVRRRRRLVVSAMAVLLVVIAARSRSPNAPRNGDELTFALDAPTSHAVTLVGDFTDWQTDSIQLHEGKSGKWEVTLRLPPGRYRYAYVVDNDEWRADPATTLVPDDFGRPTSVLTVPETQAP